MKDRKPLEEFKVHKNPSTVFIDWDYALDVCQTLDKLKIGDTRAQIKGKAAIVILAEYAATAQRCAYPPSDVGLVVVVCPPSVWFCPNYKGLSGMFVEPYSKEKHGEGLEFTGKKALWDFGSIQARMDGWGFAAEMIAASKKP